MQTLIVRMSPGEEVRRDKVEDRWYTETEFRVWGDQAGRSSGWDDAQEHTAQVLRAMKASDGSEPAPEMYEAVPEQMESTWVDTRPPEEPELQAAYRRRATLQLDDNGHVLPASDAASFNSLYLQAVERGFTKDYLKFRDNLFVMAEGTEEYQYYLHRVERRGAELRGPLPDMHHAAPRRGALPDPHPAPDPHRAERREQQLDLGKGTVGYRNYIRAVPREQRDPCNPLHVNTPRADSDVYVSKRHWDHLVRVWRRAIHLWDDWEDTPDEP